MERCCDFSIESLLNEINCDVVDLIDIIENRLKKLDTYEDDLNSSKTFVSDVNNPSKHDSNLAMENGNVWNECDPSVPNGWKTRTYWSTVSPPYYLLCTT